MECRSTERRQWIVNKYDVVPVAHIQLLANQTKHSDAGAMIENDYSGLEAPKIVGEVQRHTTTGYLITRHLLSCKINGENVEYLQAYLEITGSWDNSFTKRLMLD